MIYLGDQFSWYKEIYFLWLHNTSLGGCPIDYPISSLLMEIWVFLTLAIITNDSMNKFVQMFHLCGSVSSEKVPQSVIIQRANTCYYAMYYQSPFTEVKTF